MPINRHRKLDLHLFRDVVDIITIMLTKLWPIDGRCNCTLHCTNAIDMTGECAKMEIDAEEMH